MSGREEGSLSREQLLEIGRRARTLDELLDTPRSAEESSGEAEEAAAQILERWAFAFARGDRAAFRRRLQWDGLTEEGVLAALATALRIPPDQPPDWLAPIITVMADYSEVGLDLVAGSRDETGTGEAPSSDEPPFVELWVPFLLWARRRLLEHAGAVHELLAPEALHDLERSLLVELARTAELAVYERFHALREAASRQGATVGGEESSRSRDLYHSFLAWMSTDGMASLLTDSCVLARQLCRLLETWLDAVCELVVRLERDVTDVAREFADGTPPGRVCRVITGLSDRHHGGRQVARLRFESGLEVMYKPRDIATEAAYNRLLEWLADAGLDPAPPALRTLPRQGYGWTSYVPHAAAGDPDQVSAHFRQAGALLCLSYVLNATDLHMDNLVSGRQGPVVVDLETLIQPVFAADAATGGADGETGDRPDGVADTFLPSGLVSYLEVDGAGRVVDSGGLCGTGGQLEASTRRRWRWTNTDAMRFDAEPVLAEQQPNVVLLDGAVERAERHLEELCDGFSACYRLLVERRDVLAAPEGPVGRFRSLRTRLILRPSSLYATVLSHLRTPRYQRAGYTQDLLIDSLNRVFRDDARRPRLWPFAVEERRALNGLDIPRFTVPTDATELSAAGGEVIRGHLERSGLEEVQRRLARLSEPDLARQIDVLRRVLDSADCGADELDGSAEARRATPSSPPPHPDPLGDPCVRAACVIARQLRDSGATSPDQPPTWTESDPEHSLSRWYLYDGDLGPALLFAALARVTGRAGHRETARTVARGIVADLEAAEGRSEGDTEPIGACNGFGGVAFALATIGDLIEDERLVDLGLRAARLVSSRRIVADRRLDVEGGVAGAALALLALHDLTREEWLLERAAACGDHILAQATSTDGGGLGWPDQDGLLQPGLAHGAAGIGYALSRLSAATGGQAYSEAARRSLLFQHSVFDSAGRNWPTPVPGSGGGELASISMTAWCHGAPGIALARLGMLGTTEDADLLADIETAIDTTLRAGVGAVDHLCCGNMGRVEALLTAGQLLENVGHTRAAGIRAIMVLQRSYATGSFGLFPHGTESPQVTSGFFRGLAGIGYELLRMSCPHLIPSVLMFQTAATAADGGPSRCS